MNGCPCNIRQHVTSDYVGNYLLALLSALGFARVTCKAVWPNHFPSSRSTFRLVHQLLLDARRRCKWEIEKSLHFCLNKIPHVFSSALKRRAKPAIECVDVCGISNTQPKKKRKRKKKKLSLSLPLRKLDHLEIKAMCLKTWLHRCKVINLLG